MVDDKGLIGVGGDELRRELEMSRARQSYPDMLIKLALPPAAVVLMLTVCSTTSR
jgi:hypothetical protein